MFSVTLITEGEDELLREFHAQTLENKRFIGL